MNKTEILVRNGFVEFVAQSEMHAKRISVPAVSTILSNMAYYGYTLSKEAFTTLQSASIEELTVFWEQLEPALKEITGANRNMADFVVYKNFPKEVLDMSDAQYWTQQILMYWGVPNELFTQEPNPRPSLTEKIKQCKVLQLTKKTTLTDIHSQLMGQETKWNDVQRASFFVLNELFGVSHLSLSQFGFKDNGIQTIIQFIATPMTFKIDTATDVLRLCVAMSGGSLRTKTKFKKFKKAERKAICAMLEAISVQNLEEDMGKKKEVWKKLLSILHPGDFKCKNVSFVYNKLYNKEIKTFASKVALAFANHDTKVFKLLAQRPGEFVRVLHHAYAQFGVEAVKQFIQPKVLQSLTTVQLLKLQKYWVSVNDRQSFIVAPQGNWTKAQFLPNTKVKIESEAIILLSNAIDQVIQDRVKVAHPNGVYLDTKLSQVTLQTNDQELASYGRGTAFDIPENVTFIRTASYWQTEKEYYNSWFDNSWNFFDENWESKGSCCWDACHGVNSVEGAVFSGDPTNSKELKGRACQMIDLYLDALAKKGIRYAVWSVLAYSCIPFSDADEVLATLQWGEKPEEGNLYEPKRAQMIFPLKGNNMSKFVAYIDIKERKLVYMDANLSADVRSATSNETLLQTRMPAFVEYLGTLPTVVDLFKGNAVTVMPEVFDETSPTAILYTDESISLQDVNAYVFKPVNQKNKYTPMTLQSI